MMDLYFVLVAIAGLGVLSLILLGWGRIRLPRMERFTPLINKKDLTKNIQPDSSKEKELEEKSIDEAMQLPKQQAHHQHEVSEESALAQLGFSALDGLVNEVEELPSMTALDEPVVTVDTKSKAKAAANDDLVIFYLMAPRGKPFLGYELLQALYAVGLRFGDMSIFHCYTHSENPDILYSVASAVEPGIFDMANIGAFSCPGLSLFMMGKRLKHPTEVFEKMLETAYQLTEDLQGVLYDDERKPLTDEKLAEYRQKLGIAATETFI